MPFSLIEISNEDLSNLYSRRIFIDEIFPQVDLVQGQTTVINSLDLNYYPNLRGPYNMDPTVANGTIDNVNNSWAGITRQINTTDFEQSNVEYLEFWLMDPFLEDNNNNGGVLTFNLGNISGNEVISLETIRVGLRGDTFNDFL